MRIQRQQYLEKLISKMDNGRVKIVTGIRRCGKSYLLFEIFVDYLKSIGVKSDQIITISLDDDANLRLRNPIELGRHIRSLITDKSARYYVLIDEIQFVHDIQNPYIDDVTARVTFTDVVLGLMKIPNADIYVTGSNSKMLSSDVLTQFRDRGDEIRIFPLSFAEYCQTGNGDKIAAWRDYRTYGGMPVIPGLSSHEEKSRYLKDLFTWTYLRDILERHRISKDGDILASLVDIIASAIGSLTNPLKLSNTFKSEKHAEISPQTIDRYLQILQDAFLISKARRYDVKGKRYISTPAKYYFTDIGLRNARLSFRQNEETHIMENILYCDLARRGFDVDVGVVEHNGRNSTGKSIRTQLEVDFVINRGYQRVYIQSALSVADPDKRRQEIASLVRIPDSFRKMVLTGGSVNPWMDENGIFYMGIRDFLLNENALDM